MEKRVVVALLMVSVALSCLSVQLCAGTIYVEKITTQYSMNPTLKWYDYNYPVSGQGQINFNAASISGTSGLINTHPAENPLYQFGLVGTFTFLVPLARDASAGGLANGYFNGGATVILSGGIKDLTTGLFIYGGTGAAAQQILQAQMGVLSEDPLNPTLNRWRLQEDAFTNGKFDKGLDLILTSGSVGLASGISLNVDGLPGDDILLKMLDPKMDLSLRALSATNFLSDFSQAALPSNVKFTAPAPEPATLVLLAIGSLCLGVRKK